MALKRKKQYEGQVEKISGQRLTIETQVMAIESANVNLETMKAMRAGAEAMKTIHGAMYVSFTNGHISYLTKGIWAKLQHIPPLKEYETGLTTSLYPCMTCHSQ
jgi:hypothetical protein